jgi:alpha-L-rhamnosidase
MGEGCDIALAAGGLTWAKGTVPLPQGGRVDISWTIREADQVMELTIGVPEGHEVDVIAPTVYKLELTRL